MGLCHHFGSDMPHEQCVSCDRHPNRSSIEPTARSGHSPPNKACSRHQHHLDTCDNQGNAFLASHYSLHEHRMVLYTVVQTARVLGLYSMLYRAKLALITSPQPLSSLSLLTHLTEHKMVQLQAKPTTFTATTTSLLFNILMCLT